MTNSSLNIKMVKYDFVREQATISFVRKSGYPDAISIRKSTFESLMKGDYNRDDSEERETEIQTELRDAFTREVKTDPKIWFEDQSNKLTAEFLNGK